MQQAYEPLHHKYRPQNFDELIGQEAIAVTLKQALLTNRIAPAYIFSGPRGTGKTSSARILARSLNCLKSEQATPHPCGNCDVCKSIANGTSLDVIEIDAASNTGVDNIRELIERSKFAPVQARWKIYVIDECHMLSTAAFNALLKTLEEPPLKVVFVLATTDPQRVLPTILSRCQRFDFRRIAISAIKKHLQHIASQEDIAIEKEVVELIAQRAEGGLRDAESMLDQLFLLPKPIKVDAVWDLLGAVPEKELITIVLALVEANPINVLEATRQLLERGSDPLAILQGMASILRDLVLIKAAPQRRELCNIANESHQQLETISNAISLQQLFKWQAELKGMENQLRQSVQPRLWLEVLLLGLLADPFSQQAQKPKLAIQANKESTSKNKEEETTKEVEEISELPRLEKIQISQKNSLLNNQDLEKEDSSINLNELWQQILGRLELPSTRMLLSQQAKLTALTQEKAIIKVSENWIGMVQSRSNLLNTAINEALGSSRDLIIESQKERNTFAIKKDIDSQAKNKNEEEQMSSTKTPNFKKDINNQNEQLTQKSTQLSSNKAMNKDNIESKAKQLADFFNGEVLDANE